MLKNIFVHYFSLFLKSLLKQLSVRSNIVLFWSIIFFSLLSKAFLINCTSVSIFLFLIAIRRNPYLFFYSENNELRKILRRRAIVLLFQDEQMSNQDICPPVYHFPIDTESSQFFQPSILQRASENKEQKVSCLYLRLAIH